MILSTDITNFTSGALGVVELMASYLNDRTYNHWAKPELILYANLEQQWLAALMNSYYEDYFVTYAETNVVGGQSYYELPSDMIRLMGIEVGTDASDRDPKALDQIPIDDRRFYQMLNQANTKDNLAFFFVAGSSIRFMPEAATSSGIIRSFFVKRLSDLVNSADESELPKEHHELLALGGARRANAKHGRVNEAIERLYAQGTESMRNAIQKMSQAREERIEPWYGSFGPFRWPSGRGQTVS